MRRLIGAGLILLAAVSACSSKSGKGAKPDAKGKKAPLVTVASVTRRPMTLDVPGIGHAEPVASVGVRPQITGTLMQVRFREGETVRAGQTLFTIDQAPLAAALRQAEAGLSRDRAQLVHAEAQFRRYDILFKQDNVSREEMEQYKTNAAALAAAVAADKAQVEQARVQLDYATIAAPIGGRTGGLTVTAGNLVRPTDTNPLVVIHQMMPMRVAFTVPEKSLAQIRRSQQKGDLHVTATPPGGDTSASGRLIFVNNTVDAATGTILLKGLFANEAQTLWPGQYLNTVLTLENQLNALVVPSQSVQTGQKGAFVFVVGSDTKAEARPVTVDRVQEGSAVIADGLQPDEQVITDGQLQVVPGQPVAIVKAVKQP